MRYFFAMMVYSVIEMSKKCVLVSSAMSVGGLQPPIDWSKCMLCQQQTEALLDPTRSLRNDRDAGYRYFADVLPKIEELGELPPHHVMSRIDQRDGFSAVA